MYFEPIRFVGGHMHGRTEIPSSMIMEFPVCKDPTYDIGQPIPDPDELLVTERETYVCKRVCIPVRRPDGLRYDYIERIMVPDWLSEESAIAGLKKLGLLGPK